MAVIKKVKVVTSGNYTSKVKQSTDGDKYVEEAEEVTTGFVEVVKKVTEGFDRIVKFASTESTEDILLETGDFMLLETSDKILLES